MFSCDYVVAEANRTIKVCYEIQENLDYNERNELFNLLALVKARNPCYTAAGYIVVNRSTLFTLLSAVTTYFIIIVQFHQQRYHKSGN